MEAGAERECYTQTTSRRQGWITAFGFSCAVVLLAVLSLPSPARWWTTTAVVAATPLVARLLFKEEAMWLEPGSLVKRSGAEEVRVDLSRQTRVFRDWSPMIGHYLALEQPGGARVDFPPSISGTETLRRQVGQRLEGVGAKGLDDPKVRALLLL